MQYVDGIEEAQWSRKAPILVIIIIVAIIWALSNKMILASTLESPS
jgi:Tfp pilus assembly protein PilO